MKLNKLDAIVLAIVAACLIGVALAAYLIDPARKPIRVAYLAPASGSPQNIWTAEIDNPNARQQLTFSEYGVFDFDFSRDGHWLAYSERGQKGLILLRLLDMRTGRLIDLADCAAQEASCSAPAFSPDGARLAYHRSEFFNGTLGRSRIWLVDMTSPAYETQRLIADEQVVGHSAVWAAHGNSLAFYSPDPREPGIIIFDFVPQSESGAQLRFIPSAYGAMGSLSPNGQQIIFPDIVRRGEQFFTHLRLADLQNKAFSAFTDPNGPADDVNARWNPDGMTIALARRYTDSRWTAGHQLYLRSANDPTLQPIAHNEQYSTAYFRWNQQGDRLVMQRLPILNPNGEKNPRALPEIWTYDIASDQATKIAEDAFLPQWLAD